MRALAAALLLAGCTAQSPTVMGRPFYLRLPAHHDPARPAPLLLLLHPFYPGDGERAVQMYDLAPLADARGLIVAAPTGTMGSRGMRFWNASDACCAGDDPAPDDVAYLTAVVKRVRELHRVDEKRVFVLGYSNGGFMAHRLACDAADTFAGAVSLAGAAAQRPGCAPARPLALLEIHGDADDIVPYAGGRLPMGTHDVPSAREGVARFAAALHCGAPAAREGTPAVEEWACPAGAAALWTVRGGRHRGLATPPLLGGALDFLLAHPRP